MGVYRPMAFFVQYAAREEKNSRAGKHRLDELSGLSFSMVASLQSLASVSPAKFILAPPRPAVLNFQFARENQDYRTGKPLTCGQLLQTCLHS